MNRGALFLAIGAALLGALFVAFKPKPEAPAAVAPAAAPSAAPAAAAPVAAAPVAPAPKVFELTVKGGKLASGPEALAVREGDEVILRITSDRADQLHLHGYDLELSLKAGEAAELRFTAARSGRFEYELHKAHADLGALEVQPK